MPPVRPIEPRRPLGQLLPPAGAVTAALLVVSVGVSLLGPAHVAPARAAAAPALVRRPSRAPALPSVRAAAWWRAAVATRHYPGTAGLRAALDRRRRPGVIVFVYHQVAPTAWPLRNGPDYVTPARLARDFAFFRAHHVQTLTPAQFLAFLDGRGTVRPGAVCLTFDNGLEGVYRYAYPLARRYGVHFTTFLIGDRVHARWRPGAKYLGWNQVVAMARSGYVGIQSETYNLHTHGLVAPGRVAPALSLEWRANALAHHEPYRAYALRLRTAFMRQRALFLRHLGWAPTLLVWPFSTYNAVAVAEARAAGYRAAFAVYPGIVTPHSGPPRFALPRNPATFMWNNVPEEYADLRSGQLTAAVPVFRAIT